MLVKKVIDKKLVHKVPYFPQITRDFNNKYGDRLLKDFYNKDIFLAYEKGLLSKCDAIYLSLGNHAIGISAPWWTWDQVEEEFSYSSPPSFMPKTKGTGSYSNFEQYSSFLKENFGIYITVFIWGSHFEKAYFLRGIENFLADLAVEPEFSKELLDMIIRKNIVMLENILTNKNIDGVLLGSDWGSQKSLLMSPDTWRGFLKEGEKKEYDLISSYNKHVWLHSCGNIEEILPDLSQMKVDVLNPLQPECMDIFKIKKDYGKDFTFWGGISTQDTLPYGNVDQVYKKAEEVIQTMSENGGYIAAPAQELQDDVPYENFIALMEVFRHFGL